jgi:hypothetical protein
MVTMSPKAEAILEFLQEILDDLADELSADYSDVRILLRIMAK